MNDHLFTPWSRTFSSCNTYLVYTYDSFRIALRLKYVYVLRFAAPQRVKHTKPVFPSGFLTCLPRLFYPKNAIKKRRKYFICYPRKVLCKYDTENRSMA